MNNSHLLTIDSLSYDNVMTLLHQSQKILDNKEHLFPQTRPLKDKIIVNLFLEPSTRTRVSFEIAAKRLGGEVINITGDNSSLKKGESLLDTLYTLEALGASQVVIRHSENNILGLISKENVGVRLINAGDGSHEHPTQALLDMLAIRQIKKDIAALKIVIVGDVLRSRVANSHLALFKKLGVKEICCVAPEEFMPSLPEGITSTTSLKQGLENADVIIVLRIQHERILQSSTVDLHHYQKHFCLTQENLSFAKSDAVVLHPGPMNRGIEISSEVADGPRSLIRHQVTCGVAMRMAILRAPISP